MNKSNQRSLVPRKKNESSFFNLTISTFREQVCDQIIFNVFRDDTHSHFLTNTQRTRTR